ncbi:MAG: cytochrome C [Pseudomonadota bacterium]
MAEANVLSWLDKQTVIGAAAMIIAASINWSPPARAEAPFPLTLKGHGGPVRAITVSKDFKEAATASFDYGIILWALDGDKAHIRHRLFGHNAAVNDVAFVPGRTEVVSVSDDGSFAIWDSATGTLKAKIEDTADKVLDVAVSPDGKHAAAARWDGSARLYDLTAQEEAHRLEDHRGAVNAVAFSNDGSTVFTGAYDGIIRAFDTENGSPLPPVYNFGWGINVLLPLADGKRIAFGALDGTVATVDLKGENFREIAKFERPVLALALSPDGRTIAAGNGGGFIHLFDTDSLESKRDAAGSFGPIWGLAFTGNDDALYHVGLDNFASWHDLSANGGFQPIQGKFPRQFQVQEAGSPGELEFNRKCSICHTLTPDGGNRAGPTLYNVFGREAGTLPGYDYSEALIRSSIVWNTQTIGELFDKGPDIVVPGTKMPVQRLKSIEKRDELLDFLREATAPSNKRKKANAKGGDVQ